MQLPRPLFVMSIADSRFDSLRSILAGTATVAAIVISQATAVSGKTAQEIAKIAIVTTVQINSSGGGGGSGAILAKTGTTYTVLTAAHVVQRTDRSYTIRTHAKKDYPVTSVQRLPASQNAPDLALVTFNSSEEYPVATLGDSQATEIGTNVYVSGYPATGGLSGANREYEFSPGIVTSLRTSAAQGYTMRYNAVARPGMSGGPVFDSEGRVVGIHGQGDTAGFVETQSGRAEALRTGFSSGIPIQTYLAVKSQFRPVPGSGREGQSSPNDRLTARLNHPQTATDYYARGIYRQAQGDKIGAIADYTEAIRLNPNYSEAFFHRGNTRYRYGDKNGAIADYTEAIRINPNYAKAYFSRGHARYTQGDFPAAIADLTEAIRINPNLAEAYGSRGVLRSIQGDKEAAIADLQKAAELFKQQGKTNDYQKAMSLIEKLRR